MSDQSTISDESYGGTSRHLCEQLLAAETGDQVVGILQSAGYWDNHDAWRPLGDNTGNVSTVANQQSDPVSALAEKVTNAIDARLVNECRAQGHDPESPDGPTSPRMAVAKFFEKRKGSELATGGDVWDWTSVQRSREADKITVAVSSLGHGSPACVSIADEGEGQTPDAFPETLCSLNRSNKDRTHFAQGRFNMGGTGALRFCGEHHLQLVISHRNRSFLEWDRPADEDMWGFTVVRREEPPQGHRNSVYTYLAPVGSREKPRNGDVPRFAADTFPIFPEASEAGSKTPPKSHGRAAVHGTLVKLYDYLPKLAASRDAVIGLDTISLLRQLEIRLLNLALPVRLYDCRTMRFDRTNDPSASLLMHGLSSRLGRTEAQAMEQGFPKTFQVIIDGDNEVRVAVYAFGMSENRGTKAKRYRNADHGLLFVLNDQMQGKMPTSFFRRKAIGMSLLADSLLVIVDCSTLPPKCRDDLFMASRDRIADTDFSQRLLSEISDQLNADQDLRELRHRRTAELTKESVGNMKSAREIFELLHKHDAALLKFLQGGNHIPGPGPGTGHGPDPDMPFEGKPHPSYFHHLRKPTAQHVTKQVQQGNRATLKFDTDVENCYFTRDNMPGSWTLRLLEVTHRGTTIHPIHDTPMTTAMSLRDGVATLHLDLERAASGDEYRCQITVQDETVLKPFSLEFTLMIAEPQPKTPKPPHNKKTDNLDLPEMAPVERHEWECHDPPFTATTAVRIRQKNGSTQGTAAYTWWWNMDNGALVRQIQDDVKATSGNENSEAIRSVFQQAMLLTGMSALRVYEEHISPAPGSDTADTFAAADIPTMNAEDFVEHVSASFAPVAWPIISRLSQLSADDISADD